MNRSVDEANNDYIGSKNLQKALADIQGISEKCTGAFKFQCLVIFEVSIYPKILPIYKIHKKKLLICFHFITNINIRKYILKKYFLSNFYKYYFGCT